MKYISVIVLSLMMFDSLSAQIEDTPSFSDKWKYSSGSFETINFESNVTKKDYFETVNKTMDGGTSTFLILSDSPSYIDDKPVNLLIYPNPSFGIFNLEVNTSAIESFAIANILGETVYQENSISTTYVQFDVSFLTRGLYFIKTKIGQSFITDKIIIQ